MTIALYVDLRGPYPAILGHDRCRDATRDARLYLGPDPVVAHPPCGPWGRYAHWCQQPERGEFAAALADMRAWGGVLEHPAESKAWDAYHLPEPRGQEGGWTVDLNGWWSAWVFQGRWGDWLGRKKTWILWRAAPGGPAAPPALTLPPLPPPHASKRGAIEMMSSKDPRRWLSPEPFARLLVSLAEAAA